MCQLAEHALSKCLVVLGKFQLGLGNPTLKRTKASEVDRAWKVDGIVSSVWPRGEGFSIVITFLNVF